jgi:predicted  nucleic acid-binding Zn-ribbon protein
MPTPCEDLATKAELQELRDQLNHLLGEKEDGSKETIFAKGKTNTLIGAAGGVTLLGMAKVNAPKVITELVLERPEFTNIAKDFASGNATWTTVKGNAARVPLPELTAVTKTAGQGVVAAETATTVASTAAGGVTVVATLAQIAATLAINKATVDIFDYRINQEAAGTQAALDAQNTTMLNLYQKHQGNLEAVNVQIEQNRQIASQNRQSLTIVQADLFQQSLEIQTFNDKLTAAQTRINELIAENNTNAVKINELQDELVTVKTDLTRTITTLTTQLQEAQKIITSQTQEIEKLTERMSLYEERVSSIETRIDDFESQSTEMQADFNSLREELDLIKELNPELITERQTIEEHNYDKVTYYETAEQTYERLFEENKKPPEERKKWSTITQYELQSEITERKIREDLQARKHGFGNPSATPGAAAAQTGILETAKKLGDPNAPPTDISTNITPEDLINNPEIFGERLELLLDRITPNVTPDQFNDFAENLGDRIDGVNENLIGFLLPRLDDIADKTEKPRIAEAVEDGICSSLNGAGSCPATPGNPNPTQGLKGMQDKIGDLINAANLLQTSAIGQAVKRIDNTVHHPKWGLQNAFKFGETAWKATQADKVLSLVNTALNIHNAVMLSNNLGRSMAYIANNTLAAFGIKDATTNSPIDVGSLVKGKLNSMINTVLGATQADALRRQLASFNRIYQAGANVLYSVRSIMDSTYDIAETTGENVSQIGNALKKAGAVRENAYKLMPTDFRSTSRVQRRLQKLGNAADTIEQISSDALDVTTEVKEMKANQKEFNDELEKAVKEQSKEDETKKKEAIANPEASVEDEIRTLPKEDKN